MPDGSKMILLATSALTIVDHVLEEDYNVIPVLMLQLQSMFALIRLRVVNSASATLDLNGL